EHLVTAGHGSPASLWSSGLGAPRLRHRDSSRRSRPPGHQRRPGECRWPPMPASACWRRVATPAASACTGRSRGQPVAELRIRSDYASFAPGRRRLLPAVLAAATMRLRLLRVAFDSAGKRTLAAGVHLRKGRPRRPQRPVTALACAPGLVMSASEDCTRRLWDAGLRECSTVFNHHKGAVLACALAPDGSLGFTGANDATSRWCTPSRRRNGDWVTSLDCFRATDSAESELRLVSGSNDFSVKLWRVQPEAQPQPAAPPHRARLRCQLRPRPAELPRQLVLRGGATPACWRGRDCVKRPPRAQLPQPNLGGRSQNLSGRYGRCRCIVEVEEVEEEIASLSFSSSEEEDSDDGGAVKVSLDDIDFGRGGCGRGGGGGDWDA
uniref:WD_REPEATS_REGION domain-containing protein n=1 Tax=Macrostomum lignano TaxID=282301 RepID=A0A1I8FPK0_9PLAT